jgi:hypothetical protein
MRASLRMVFLPTILSAALAGSFSIAEEPRKEESQKAGAPAKKPATKDDQVHVYTNDDLDRLPPDPTARRSEAGPPAGKDVAGAASKAKGVVPYDALGRLQDEQAKAAGLATQIADAERKVTAAEGRVQDLEKKALAIKNPFLPRPEVSPEQAEAWRRMNNVERLKATEDELAAARKAVESAKADLEKLRSAAGVH